MKPHKKYTNQEIINIRNAVSVLMQNQVMTDRENLNIQKRINKLK